jgi:hypothetical protein
MRVQLTGLALLAGFLAGCATSPRVTSEARAGRTFYVDGQATHAADANAGTAAKPWKTICRAGSAKELKPGDTVLIREGVYREHVDITVAGEPGRPITFAAAPGARVVIKGSEIVKGPWTEVPELQPSTNLPVFSCNRVWKTRLGEEFFTDPKFAGTYADPAKRWVSQVIIDDEHPLQMIGPDPVYKNTPTTVNITQIGRDKRDLIPMSFFFDPQDQSLYIRPGGQPAWYSIEVGVRGHVLTAQSIHDVVLRGLEMRHNRQPCAAWPMVALHGCARIVLERCRTYYGDFSGLGLGFTTNCVLRACDLSNNGGDGLNLYATTDTLVEDCALMFNNYRRFGADWGVAAGMKCIPGNLRTTIRRCEAAYNPDAEGIWFDSDNADIRILDNVVHHNGDAGIMFEINPGGLIAGNLVYANNRRGIFVSGSSNTWVVHNTVADNASGIVVMTQGPGTPPRHTRVLNNLLIRNYVTDATTTRGSDLTLELPTNAAARADMDSASDYNVFADNAWTPFMRHNWDENNTFAQWQERFGQDRHSKLAWVDYERAGTGFSLTPSPALNAAGSLPEAVTKTWKPRHPQRVGADLTQWP